MATTVGYFAQCVSVSTTEFTKHLFFVDSQGFLSSGKIS